MGVDEIEDARTIPLIRIHSECITRGFFNSRRCDCGEQLVISMQLTSERGCEAVIYLRQAGRGIGIENKLKACALKEQGFDMLDANLKLGLPADDRDDHDAIKIFKHHRITRCNLLTNNPTKRNALEQSDIELNSTATLHIEPNHPSCVQYLKTKQVRMRQLSSLHYWRLLSVGSLCSFWYT